MDDDDAGRKPKPKGAPLSGLARSLLLLGVLPQLAVPSDRRSPGELAPWARPTLPPLPDLFDPPLNAPPPTLPSAAEVAGMFQPRPRPTPRPRHAAPNALLQFRRSAKDEGKFCRRCGGLTAEAAMPPNACTCRA